MGVSYAKKTAIYASVLRANPKVSANEIGRRYAGTQYAMRKQDRNDFVKGFKEQLKQAAGYKKNISNSDMSKVTQERLGKAADSLAYKHAKSATRKGKRDGLKPYGSVKGLQANTFNRFPDYDGEKVLFYGE